MSGKFSWTMMMARYSIFSAHTLLWVTKVLCISKRINNCWKKVLLNFCKWIVVIRIFNFSELALYMFHTDCQHVPYGLSTFVKNIFIYDYVDLPKLTTYACNVKEWFSLPIDRSINKQITITPFTKFLLVYVRPTFLRLVSEAC